MWAWGAARSRGRKLRVTRSSPTTLMSTVAPVLVAGVGHRVQADPGAGVVDQQVGVAVAVADGGREGLDRGRVGDVQGQGGGADLLGQGLEAVGAAGAGDHVEAGPGQPAGAGRPDPAGRPGDDRDPLACHGGAPLSVGTGRPARG